MDSALVNASEDDRGVMKVCKSCARSFGLNRSSFASRVDGGAVLEVRDVGG